MSDFLGTGWAFPVGLNVRGGVALVRREQDVEQAIAIILRTPKGQRMMRPEFGCAIHDLLFAPNDTTTAGLASYYVEEALAMWEPRIVVQNVNAAPDLEHPECLLITIRYRIKASYDLRTLVFPFYRIPNDPASST